MKPWLTIAGIIVAIIIGTLLYMLWPMIVVLMTGGIH
jgi:hypothetical protein